MGWAQALKKTAGPQIEATDVSAIATADACSPAAEELPTKGVPDPSQLAVGAFEVLRCLDANGRIRILHFTNAR